MKVSSSAHEDTFVGQRRRFQEASKLPSQKQSHIRFCHSHTLLPSLFRRVRPKRLPKSFRWQPPCGRNLLYISISQIWLNGRILTTTSFLLLPFIQKDLPTFALGQFAFCMIRHRQAGSFMTCREVTGI